MEQSDNLTLAELFFLPTQDDIENGNSAGNGSSLLEESDAKIASDANAVSFAFWHYVIGAYSLLRD